MLLFLKRRQVRHGLAQWDLHKNQSKNGGKGFNFLCCNFHYGLPPISGRLFCLQHPRNTCPFRCPKDHLRCCPSPREVIVADSVSGTAVGSYHFDIVQHLHGEQLVGVAIVEALNAVVADLTAGGCPGVVRHLARGTNFPFCLSAKAAVSVKGQTRARVGTKFGIVFPCQAGQRRVQ